MISNAGLILVSILVACVFFHPRVLRMRLWRATVTPLASIIGSGFLVVGPILANTFGSAAWLAMAALCSLGYLYGAVMRHNIRYVQPGLKSLPPTSVFIERASDFALSLAYFVSVAYYLNLFAAFGMRIVEVESRLAVQIVASIAIATVGVIGLSGGLRALERIEVYAVGLKLCVILGIFAALILFATTGHTISSPVEPQEGLGKLQVLLGLIVLVQGFETSRYLGAEYDTQTRLRTMRYAQWISTFIYVGFVFLLTHLFHGSPSAEGGETAIIDMLAPVGAAVTPLLIAAALASQSSAAVADMNGASGLLAEATHKRLSVNVGSLVTALVAIGITWSAGIYEIITYASKAFVIFYALQSLQALLSSLDRKEPGKAALFAVGLLIAIGIVLFGKPVAS
ncbi:MULTISPECIES: hypothetical protein [unclassified Pseudomonas]|uniref:hypothetical protein n=1 Tax=unclassified Pseudomonas TaxID=196821 RepID=UPI0030DC90A0